MPRRLPIRPPAEWLRVRDQWTIAALAACSLLAMLTWWWVRGGHRGELIEIDRAAPLTARFQVDVNRAEWPELIQLPGVGPILAQRIIIDRNENGAFNGVEDLRRVNGIGPRTLERIKPYLLPLPDDREWAGGSGDDREGIMMDEQLEAS